MPFWSGGYLFVPASVFADRELGLSCSYNSQKGTAAIWVSDQPGRALIFDLREDLVWDGVKENNYSPPALVRSSGLFVAVSTVAVFFGLTYTNTKVNHGYLVRIRSASSVLTDADFIDAGASQFLSRYSHYVKLQQQPGAAPDPGGSVTVTPGTAVTAGNRTTALCIRAEEPAEVTALLDAIAAGSYVTFYAGESFLRENADLIRRITASGHGIGLLADAAARQPAEEQLRAANQALAAAAGVKSRLCLVENAGNAELERIESAGYRCLRPDVNRAAAGLLRTSARSLLKLLNARPDAVSVWLDGNVTAEGLETFQSAARKENDRLAAMTETA
jgi:hypothetical protein